MGVDREADELAARSTGGSPEVAATADQIRDRLQRQLAHPPSKAATEFGTRRTAADAACEQERQAVERERIAKLWPSSEPERRRLRLPAFQRRRGASPAIRPRVRSGRTVRRRAAARTSCRAPAPADPDLDPPLGRLAHRGVGR
jgi:hypothetical protein